MQPGSPEHAAELERLTSTLVQAMRVSTDALRNAVRHTTALTCGLAFLVAELERRGGLDREALAEMAAEGARIAQPDDLDLERAVRDLFGRGEVPGPIEPARPGLRVIEGGKA